MPQRPNKPCKRPGCPAITRDKSGYCGDHLEYGVVRRKAARRGKVTLAFYGTAAWKKFVTMYKNRHPLCEDCLEQGLTVPMYCVDHIMEIKDGGALLDEGNARSLCMKCHSRKTAEEQRRRRAWRNGQV